MLKFILLAIFISVTFQIVLAARPNKDNLQVTEMEIQEIKCKKTCLKWLKLIPGKDKKAVKDDCNDICNKDREIIEKVIEPFLSPGVDNW